MNLALFKREIKSNYKVFIIIFAVLFHLPLKYRPTKQMERKIQSITIAIQTPIAPYPILTPII